MCVSTETLQNISYNCQLLTKNRLVCDIIRLIKSKDMNTKGGNQKNRINSPNPLEALKDLGQNTAQEMRSEANKLSADFMQELLGIKAPSKNFSGEIMPGEPIDMSEVYSGKYEETIKIKKQMAFERRIIQEERIQLEKRTGELRMQLTAVREEILILASKTQELAEETQIAAMQAPIEPGLYHVIFFEKLLEFIKSFRKKIEESGVWLHSLNRRAHKKNVWGANYKKKGASYLLSSEHYLQRSAG
jgi:hypothetical protein